MLSSSSIVGAMLGKANGGVKGGERAKKSYERRSAQNECCAIRRDTFSFKKIKTRKIARRRGFSKQRRVAERKMKRAGCQCVKRGSVVRAQIAGEKERGVVAALV